SIASAYTRPKCEEILVNRMLLGWKLGAARTFILLNILFPYTPSVCLRTPDSVNISVYLEIRPDVVVLAMIEDAFTVINDQIQLLEGPKKRTGDGIFVCCPFHDERTPS